MGRATSWFRSLLRLKKPGQHTNHHPGTDSSRPRAKRRWSFVRSRRDSDTARKQQEYDDQEEHAVAVAAATAAVAEAAVAAAQAAAAVVNLTSSRPHLSRPEDLAAIRIQSAFRGYLARRALRALRGLVRLQAIVRGHIERKKTAQRFRRMQAMMHAQSRVRASRAMNSESSLSDTKSSYFQSPGPPTPEKIESGIRSRRMMMGEASPVLKRTGSKANGWLRCDHSDRVHVLRDALEHRKDERAWDRRAYSGRICSVEDVKDDKVLEVHSAKHQIPPKRRNLFHSSHLVFEGDGYSHGFASLKDSVAMPFSPYSAELRPMSRLDFYDMEEGPFCTANNSPQIYSASSRGGGSARRSPMTPTTSDGTRSCRSSGYTDHPNYMAYTESSRAKVRSLSAPKQRTQYERSGSARSYSLYGSGEPRFSTPNLSTLHANFRNKAYPGSCRLDSLGTGIRY